LEQPSAFSFQLSAKDDFEFAAFNLGISQQMKRIKGFPGKAES
jgi:hypothetical protein